jgi:hypothetical protein
MEVKSQSTRLHHTRQQYSQTKQTASNTPYSEIRMEKAEQHWLASKKTKSSLKQTTNQEVIR